MPSTDFCERLATSWPPRSNAIARPGTGAPPIAASMAMPVPVNVSAFVPLMVPPVVVTPDSGYVMRERWNATPKPRRKYSPFRM
jgi:hypothetical protein